MGKISSAMMSWYVVVIFRHHVKTGLADLLVYTGICAITPVVFMSHCHRVRYIDMTFCDCSRAFTELVLSSWACERVGDRLGCSLASSVCVRLRKRQSCRYCGLGYLWNTSFKRSTNLKGLSVAVLERACGGFRDLD